MARRTKATDRDNFRAQLEVRRALSRAMARPVPVNPIVISLPIARPQDALATN